MKNVRLALALPVWFAAILLLMVGEILGGVNVTEMWPRTMRILVRHRRKKAA